MAAGAALYSSVGHGGASAYLAMMALFSVAPEVMRPTALTLNFVGSVIVGAALGNWLGTERLRRARLLQALALVMTPTSSEIGDLHLLPAGAAA